jgi:16S rRNA (guanine966-N2)-methyltransferase
VLSTWLYRRDMRIVAGTARGRRLHPPEGDGTRPTSDRVREAVFNSLFSADAIEGALVLDLFAGSGAMGLEALSRGAAFVTFVESSPIALRVLRENIDLLEFGDECTVLPVDAMRYLETAPRFDLAIFDPPYPFDQWPGLLANVHAEVIVVESDRVIDLGTRWASFKQARYAGTVVELARVIGDSPSAPSFIDPEQTA